jgi:two-component sensor histidine kinase
MAGYLGELCQNFVHLQSGSERHVDVIRDADHLTLDVDRAINVALIAGEAITNALKHAFPDGRRGTIQVGLHRLGEDVLRNPRLACSIPPWKHDLHHMLKHSSATEVHCSSAYKPFSRIL